MKDVGNFINENRIPRYFLYGIILIKATAIYDKLRQIVAINSVYYQMILDERKNLKFIFTDKDML
jgi:hypothetical protein